MSLTILDLKVPAVGESVSEVQIGDWLKAEGAAVRQDESLAVLETDKATMEVYAPASGRLSRILAPKGARVKVGDIIAQITPGEVPADAPPAEPPAAAPPAPAPDETRVMPSAARLAAVQGIPLSQARPTGPGGRLLKEDVQRAATAAGTPAPAEAAPAPSAPRTPPSPPAAPAAVARAAMAPAPAAGAAEGLRSEEVMPMSLLRRKVAERLVEAQHNAALLTTFNEVDLSFAMTLRKEHQDRFLERYKVKLGFMSFFVKATVEALKETPQLNAEIRDQAIVYRNYYDIGVAIGGGRGLVVPVLRNAERLSFAETEQAIAAYAQKAKENKIRPDDLQGGTFTITNGGVYGSLLSTPLVNPPQSGVLGMHAIQDRPVAVGGQVVIRPMMYVALTYDHRIVDGREAVTFLKRVKELVENPVRMLIEI